MPERIYVADKQTLDSVKEDTTKILGAIGESGLGGGLPTGNCSNLRKEVKGSVVRLRWADPGDSTVGGVLLSSWAGTKLVRKRGGYPETENDGTVVCDNKVLNAYDSVWFEDDLGADAGDPKEYYYRTFPYNDQGLHNRNPSNHFQEFIVYGFRINKYDSNPATRVEYLESTAGMTPAHMDYARGRFDYGDWANVWFVEENKPYMVNYDGTPAYELDPDDYTKKMDGTASDISNSSFNGNAMAKIPAVWLKQYEDENYEYCYIANGPADAGFKAYAHTRSDGTVMEYKWLRIYKSALIGGKLRSLSGQQPTYNNTATAEITAAVANGQLWYTTAWADRNLIDMLLKLMSCHDNSQAIFGNGNLNYNKDAAPIYGVIKTGSLNKTGQFFGYNDNIHDVKVFHLEGWWANQWERIAGMVYGTDGKLKVKMTPTYNTDGSGYINTGVTFTGTSSGYTSKTKMTEYGRLPIEVSGSETTYTCDGMWFNTTQFNYALAGGDCNDGLRCGASCLDVGDLVSNSYWNIGAALSCEHPVTA